MAATTATQISSADWTDLGAGPMLLQAIEGEVKFAIADSKPAAGAIAFNLRPEYGPRDANTTSHVWAISTAVSGKVTVISAPVTA